MNKTQFLLIVAILAAQLTGNPTCAHSEPAPVAWFKADAISGILDGAEVKVWTDSTGDGFDAMTPHGSNGPKYSASALNNLPVLRFDNAVNQYLLFKRPVQDDFTIVCVFRSQQGLSDGTAYFQGASLVQGDLNGIVSDFGLSLNLQGQLLAGTGYPDTYLSSGPGFNDGSPHVVTFTRQKSSGVDTLFVDGKQTATAVGGTQSLVAPSRLAIGAQLGGGGGLTGDIAEVEIYSSVLAATDRIAVENGLKSKWGIK